VRSSRIVAAVGAAALSLASVAALAQMGGPSSGSASASASVVDAQGNLRVPQDYRTIYQGLGSWAVAADNGQGSKELHQVFASPGAIEAYRKTGKFPDGTVLVGAATQPMTTGTVSHAQQLKGWFVMVRDSSNSHPGNPLWGDGWGWSWFDADKPLKTTSTNYKVDCQTCHIPAKATDWIYVSGYPTLHQ
jgi:hypothetical protein